MGNKLVWSCFCVPILALFIHYFGLFQFSERKCAQYRPLSIDITFSHRQACLESPEPSQKVPLNLDTLQEIKFRGYNATSYTILSGDGYYSSIYRISGNTKSQRRPVLQFPPFGQTAQIYLIQPGSRNLAFTMVDAGYEVWIPNVRGTPSCQNHTHLDPSSPEYWDFGYKEISTLDLPLMVELMLKETGTDKVYYICYSSGCAIYLAGLVDVPELNDKFKAGFLLSPGSFYGSSYSPVHLFLRAIHGTPLEPMIFWVMGGKIDTPLPLGLGPTLVKICSLPFLRCGFCDNFLSFFFGANPEQMDYSNLPNFMAKSQGTAPLQMGFNVVQCDVACDFRRYDYGKTRNMMEYGSVEAPSYNLSGITVPTYIFYGESDSFVTPWDAQRTKDAIPPKYLKGFYQVDWPKFNHIDFLIAKDADILVYNNIRDIMNGIEVSEPV